MRRYRHLLVVALRPTRRRGVVVRQQRALDRHGRDRLLQDPGVRRVRHLLGVRRRVAHSMVASLLFICCFLFAVWLLRILIAEVFLEVSTWSSRRRLLGPPLARVAPAI